MEKKESLKNNIFFQLFYQIVIVVIPLIISPFLTRRLGKTGLGVYTYANSIAYYFVLLANLGIAKHGQRIIAKATNQNELRKRFWSLYWFHSFVSILSIVLYLCFSLIFVKDSKNIFIIQLLYVASALFDITWLFYGLENFKSVALKNALIKILECALIFVLIKDQSDLWIYSIIACGGIFLGQLILIPQAVKIVPLIKVSWVDISLHFKPMLLFTISVIAVTLYTVFDKTLLGILSTKENVALYEYANKIVALPRVLITVIGTVVFPRACKIAEDSDVSEEEKSKITYTSFFFTFILGVSALFGLICVGVPLANIYYGSDFVESGYAMVAMCGLPLIVGVGDLVRTQFLMPHEMDREYVLCMIISSVINLIISSILIIYLGLYGAIVGTYCAEIFATIFMMLACRKYYSLKKFVYYLIVSLVIGLMMFGTVEILSLFLNDSIMSLIIEVFVGIVVIFALVSVYILFIDNDMRRYIGNFRSKEKTSISNP